MNDLNVFMPLSKVDAKQRLVFGKLAAEVADHSGEIMDYDTAKEAFRTWSDSISKATDGKSLGNVRAMHKDIAAGKLVEITFDDENKCVYGCAKIVDDNEWKKCEEGVYTGFSIGGKYAKRWECPSNSNLKRYTPTLAEVSIVDNPCIPVATFEYVKSDGATEMRKFVVTKEAETDLQQVWKARDGQTFLKKTEAVSHNIDLVVKAALAPVHEALAKAEEALAEKEGDAPAEVVEKQAEVVEEVVEKAADPEALAKTIKAVTEGLQKGLYDISRLVCVIDDLNWMAECMAFDALLDGSGTNLPTDLKSILASLCEFLKTLVAEATAEITDEAAAKAIEAGLTKAQAETFQKFTGKETFKDFVAEAPVEKAQTEDLEKLRTEHAEALEKANSDLEAAKAEKEALTKSITDMTGNIGALVKRIESLEAQPAPAKGVKVVLKGHEVQESGSQDEPVEVDFLKFAHLPPEEARARIQKAKA